MSKEFKRQDYMRYLKLGKRKSKVVWRKPKGRDSKMRLKRGGYPSSPIIGRKKSNKDSGKINGLNPILVHNLSELESLDKSSAAILARVGAKKKFELIKKAEEMKIKILNVGGSR